MADNYVVITGSGFNNPQWNKVEQFIESPIETAELAGLDIDLSKVTVIGGYSDPVAKTCEIWAGGPDAQAEWARIQPLLGGWVGRAFGIANHSKATSKVQTGKDRRGG